MKSLEKYPSKLVTPLNSVGDNSAPSEKHKSLLDLGESFLTYLVGIMFGEYKRSGIISDPLETEFYKYSSRKPSFGVFLSFMRVLSKELKDTILAEKFEKGKKYAAVSDFFLQFNVLKKIVNDGADNDFLNISGPILKGRTPGSNGLMDFFDTFIMIRNIYAHPDEKAGSKEKKRKWPLGDEYYNFINPSMNAALMELIDDFDVLESYKPILVKLVDDKNKKASFLVEQGEKDKELELDLNKEDLNFVNTDLRYLLDKNNKLFVKLYYHEIPQLNPEIAKKIIDREKAKAMEPHLLEMILGKLKDDEKIDELEFLVLRDTAKTATVSDEKLFQLIEKVKNKLGIKESVGSPQNKGDIFINEKNTKSAPTFNPWWLNYLAMVKNIDKTIPKAEKQQAEKAKSSIDKLKKSKVALPINKRLASAKIKLKEKRSQKTAQIKKINERISAKREMRKNASKPEKKASLLDDINALKETIDLKRLDFDNQIEEMIVKIEEIEIERQQKYQAVDDKIELINAKESKVGQYRQWSIHKNLWSDISTFTNHLIDTNLNSNVENDEESSKEWKMTPNSWQIGELAYTYWAKIYPSEAPLTHAFHIGFAVCRSFKWLRNVQYEKVKERINQPCVLMWPAIDDKFAAKIDQNGSLLIEYKRLVLKMMEENLELLKKIGAHVQCVRRENDKGDTVPIDYYLTNKEDFEIMTHYDTNQEFNLLSNFWIMDDFMDNELISYENIALLEKNLSIYITLFGNVIKQLNEYALAQGINKESINLKLDQVNRLGKTMYKEFEKFYTGGKLKLNPDQEENLVKFAKEIGLNQNNYQYFKSQYIFSKNYSDG